MSAVWEKIESAVESFARNKNIKNTENNIKNQVAIKVKNVKPDEIKEDKSLRVLISREQTYIDITNTPQNIVHKLRGYLTIRDKTITGYEKITQCFKHSENPTPKLIIPRFAAFLLSAKFNDISYECNIIPQNPIKVTYNGSPTHIQKLILSELEKRFSKQNMKKGRSGVILNLQAGLGKTYLSLSLINKLQCRTLIVTHNCTILKQWRDLLIDKFPGTTIGTYYGESRKSGDIIVGVINSLVLKNIEGYDSPRDFYDRFDLVIFDECHEYCAPGRSKIFEVCQSPYMLGLSATPEERSDNLAKVIKWNIGPILAADKLEGYSTEDIPFKGNVVQVKYYGEDEYTKNILNEKLETISVQKMIQQFTEDKKRTKMISELVMEFYEKKYNIFVFADRRDYLLEIQDLLAEVKIKSNILTDDTELSSIRLVGGSSEEEMSLALSKQIILTTYQYMATGCSIPRMNCIILATPRKNKSRQTINRIFRLGSDYSIVRQIIDIVDWKTSLKNQYYERKKYYDSQKFTYETRVIKSDEN